MLFRGGGKRVLLTRCPVHGAYTKKEATVSLSGALACSDDVKSELLCPSTVIVFAAFVLLQKRVD